jgi:hypothetical protein
MGSLTPMNSSRGLGRRQREVKFEIVEFRIDHIACFAAFAERAGVIL